MQAERRAGQIAQYRIEGPLDPGLVPRLVGLFAQRGLVPLAMEARRREAGLEMRLWQDGIGAAQALLIEQAVRANILVTSVELTMERG